jgi:hypothetical protein
MKPYILGLLLSIGLAGCGGIAQLSNPIPLTPTATLDPIREDIAVYTAVLLEIYGSHPVYVIDQDTHNDILDLGNNNLGYRVLKPLKTETLEDYIAKNHQHYPLKWTFTEPSGQIALVDASDYYEAPSPENGLNCSRMWWPEPMVCFNGPKLGADYPGGIGIILLSKIGYNAQRTQALVTTRLEQGATKGDLYAVLLQKETGQWKVAEQYVSHWIE